MAKTNLRAKANRTKKMVSESKAFEMLLDLQLRVIMGNDKCRRIFIDFLQTLPEDDADLADLIVRVLLTLIVQDEDSRFDYVEQFHGDPQYMEVFNLAVDIRIELGYEDFSPSFTLANILNTLNNPIIY